MNSERNWSEVRREVCLWREKVPTESLIRKKDGPSRPSLFDRLVDDFNDAAIASNR
jgi:hypothetical protein